MQDAMETAAQSGEASIAEELLHFFVENGRKECFAALLYTCYDLIKPDLALEVAWTHGLVDMAMPFMIQFLREYSSKVDLLINERKEAQQAAASEETSKRREARHSPSSVVSGYVVVSWPALAVNGLSIKNVSFSLWIKFLCLLDQPCKAAFIRV